MIESLKNLAEITDRLTLWISINHNIAIPLHEKKRIQEVLNKILNLRDLSDFELDKLIKEIKPNNAITTYVNCKKCGVILNVNNLKKHDIVCVVKGKNKIKRNKANRKNQITPNKKSSKLGELGELDNFDKTVERKLDGSRDFWRYRENGKFGSHSVYDDMNDESNP